MKPTQNGSERRLLKLAFGICICGFCVLYLLKGKPVTGPTLSETLLAFSSDVSGDDPDLMAKVSQRVASPPTTLEEIGFYGAENASPEERAFRSTVFALSTAGFILGFEDKYIHEMPILLGDNGWIDPDFAQQADRQITSVGEKYETDTPEEINEYARSIFSDHVALIERGIAATKTRLLYIDVPLGDTFHLVRVSPDVADKWRNTLFLKTANERFAVTAPQWDAYWIFLTSALGLDWKMEPPISQFDASVLMPINVKRF